MSEEELGHDTSFYFKNGKELLDNKKYREAMEVFDKLIAIDPENKVALLAKGNSLVHLNKYEEAKDIFERIIRICEEHSETLDNTTSIYYFAAWSFKSNALNKLNRYEEALQASEFVIKIYGEHSEPLNKETLLIYSSAWESKGDALNKLNRYEEALQAYDKAMEINPGGIGAWNRKFFTLWENHKHEKAFETIEKALSTSELEDKLSLLEIKALALTLDAKYSKALDVCNKVIDNNPNQKYAQMWLNKGDVFCYLEAYRYALNSYEKAISSEPQNATAWKFKGVALHNLNKHDKCQEAFTQVLNLDPKDVQIYNILSGYHLRFGDIENASKYIETALTIEKENAISLYIKGKIKIEEQDYNTSIRCFKKAISLDLRNPIYLLWDSYAKYLMAESNLTHDEKKYQDVILGIIRELGRVNNCNYINNSNSKMITWLFYIIPHQLKNVIIDILIVIKQTLIDQDIGEKNTVKLLEIINLLLKELENTKIIAYNYYFLGCFYYKINDYLTAIEHFKHCSKLNPDYEISKSAIDVLDNIWNIKIRPSIWRWWLYSPSNTWLKRISFLILSLFLTGILLPSLVSKLIFSAYNLVLKPISTYQLASDFPIIKLIISSITIILSTSILSLVDFFSSINWAENTTQLTLLTLTILFILTSPNIHHFKSSQIEIEIHPPPAFELTPSIIGNKLEDLVFIINYNK